MRRSVFSFAEYLADSDHFLQAYLKEYLGYLDNYEIIPAKDKELYERKTSSVADPAKRRELKIKQYQKEKELRLTLEVRMSL